MFSFGDCTFDPDTGELDGPRRSVRLRPQPARLLAMLLEAGGELVEREPIHEALWPDTTVDFDAGLHTCMRQIRAALRKCGADAECVETLAKRGYRITVAVERKPAGGEETDRAAAPAPARSTAGSRSLYVVILVVLVVAAAVVFGWGLLTDPQEAPPLGVGTEGNGRGEAPLAGRSESAGPARLAVVPFVDPSSDANAAFNRDLTEAFVTALVRAAPDQIAVIGPSTTARYFTEGGSLADVAAAVDADFVLHGGHRSSADIFFVEVVLPDGEHLFAQRMELDLAEAAEAPQEVVSAMTSSILRARARR